MNSVTDPTPLTPLGKRDVSQVDDVDTDSTWNAIKTDLPFSGFTNQQIEDVVREYDGLHDPEARKEWVWHCAEWRARMPGGHYFVARYILDMTRVLRNVHDKQMGRRFENVPGSSNRVFLLCHRDSYKSTFTGIAEPVCVLGTRPWERILLSGASDDDTSEMLNAVTGSIETNPKVLAIFPHLDAWRPKGGRAKKWSEKAILIKGYYGEGIRDPRGSEGMGESFGRNRGLSRREASIMVCGAEKSPTRLHPTLWIFDDLINLINSGSETLVQKVLRFVREVLGNLGAGTMPCMGSGTMWRRDDLAAILLEGKHKFDVFVMPVGKKNDDGGITFNMPRADVLAQLPPWEEPDPHCGFDADTFADVCEDLEDYEIACQYWCDPSAVKKRSLDPADWREFDDDGPTVPWQHLGAGEESFARWFDPMFCFAVADLASTISRTAKWTAVWILAIDSKRRIWVVDGIYDKMEPWMQQNMFMQMYLEPKPDEIIYWQPRPLGETSPRAERGLHPSAWRPEFVCLEKANISTTFKGGMKPREISEGFSIPWFDVPIQGQGEEVKLRRIVNKVSAVFKHQRVRVRRNIVKPSHFTGGVIDVTQKFRQEYMGWTDSGVPVDGLDAFSLGSEWYFTRGGEAVTGQTPEDEDRRNFAAQMLEGVLTAATQEDADELGVKRGSVLPVMIEEDFLKVDMDLDGY